MERSISQPAGTLPAALTLVVGVGERGGRVVRGLGALPPFGSDDSNPGRHLGRMIVLSPDLVDGDDDGVLPTVEQLGRVLAGNIVRRLEAMLSHGRVEDARRLEAEAQSSALATKLLVVVFADLGEPLVRETVPDLLRELDRLVYERLGPIVGRNQRWDTRNLVVLPVLSTPFVESSPARVDIARTVRGLYDWAAEGASTPRSVSTFYVVEDVTDLSVLESEDLDSVLENFALCLTECLPGAEQTRAHGTGISRGDKTLEAVVRGTQVANPLGTFAVARAEPCADRMREYARCSLAIDVLEQVREAAVAPEGVRGHSELENKVREEFSLEPPTETRESVERAVRDAAPTAERVPAWYRFKREVLQGYGPDLGDCTTSGDSTPSPDAPWLRDVEQRLEQATAKVDDRFEGLIEEYRGALADWEHGPDGRSGVRARLRETIDEVFRGASGTDGRLDAACYARARQRARVLARRGRADLRAAISSRDAIEVEDPPKLDGIRAAHAALLAATRAIPQLGLLTVGAVVAFVVLAATLAPALHAIAPFVTNEPESLLAWALRRHPYVTASVVSFVVVGTIAAIVFWGRYQQAVAAWEDLWVAANRLFRAERGSLASYFRGRLDYAWAVARVGAMTRTVEAVEADAKRLNDVERAIAGALERYQRRMAAVGVIRDQQGRDDASGLFSSTRPPLVWPLLDPAVVVDEVRKKPADAGDALTLAERDAGLFSRWREVLPFVDDRVLDAALDDPVQKRIPRPVTGEKALGENLAHRLVDFAGAQRRSLPLGLSFRGREALDREQGIETVVEGLLISSAMHGELDTEHRPAGDDFVVLNERAVTERVYAVRISNGVAAEAVSWLDDKGGA